MNWRHELEIDGACVNPTKTISQRNETKIEKHKQKTAIQKRKKPKQRKTISKQIQIKKSINLRNKNLESYCLFAWLCLGCVCMVVSRISKIELSFVKPMTRENPIATKKHLYHKSTRGHQKYEAATVPPPNSEIKERIRKRYENERIKIDKLLTLGYTTS